MREAAIGSGNPLVVAIRHLASRGLSEAHISCHCGAGSHKPGGTGMQVEIEYCGQ
jgi:hypothetical protein